MRGIYTLFAGLGFLCCAGFNPARAQIMVPEELQATNNITLLQSTEGKLWAVQLISESNGISTYSLAAKQSGIWKRFPAVKLSNQLNGKTIEFSDIEVYHDRIYLAGNFVLAGSKDNCLIYFDIAKQTWGSLGIFSLQTGIPTVSTLSIAEGYIYAGGLFGKIGSLECNNMCRIGKGFTPEQVRIKTAVGSSGMVTQIESDSTQKIIHIAGNFRNILGKAAYGFVQFRILDSTFLATPVSNAMSVLRMRNFGSKMLIMAEDTLTKKRKVAFISKGQLILVPGIDTLANVVNFFVNKGNFYFLGEARTELDIFGSGIFRISESTKAQRVYRQFSKILRAEGFDGNIYVYGNFFRLFSNTPIYDNFNLARIDDSYKRFYGRLFHDKDGDGSFSYQNGDVPIGGKNMIILPYNVLIPTEKNGMFTFIVPIGKNQVTKAYCEATDGLKIGASYIFQADTFTERLVEFPVKFQSNTYSNVRISVTAAAGWKCRKDTSELYVVKVVNTGLVPVQPDVMLTFDGKITAINPLPAPQIDPGATTKLTWFKQTIPAGGENTYLVKLTAPSTSFSDQEQLNFNASVANVIDNNPADDTDTLEQTVTSYVDAMAKFQYPEVPNGDSFAWLDPNCGKIDYIIRFTNLTSDTVSTVVVRDTIATPSYVTYIQETGSSHPFSRYVYTTPLLPNKVIVAYTFSGLKLPPNPSGNTELVNSSGYVGFRLGLKQDLTSGTNLQNRASIYLDNTEPYLTNTVMARVSYPTGVKDMGMVLRKVYPNPFDNSLFIDGSTKGESFRLFSIEGKLLYNCTLTGEPIHLNDQHLKAGAYMWSIVTNDGKTCSGIILKN